MIILLWALIGTGVSLTLLILYLPDNNQKKHSEDVFCNKLDLEEEVYQLKEQMYALRVEFKQLVQTHLLKIDNLFQNKEGKNADQEIQLKVRVERLNREKNEQRMIIMRLQENEKQILRQLNLAREKMLKTKEDLIKQKIINSEIEIQFQESKKRSEELTDGLSYELNN